MADKRLNIRFAIGKTELRYDMVGGKTLGRNSTAVRYHSPGDETPAKSHGDMEIAIVTSPY